jgi:ATP-dependent exoDNAse (exonuclease V) beta subunit
MGTGKRGDITRERLNLIDRRTRLHFQSSCAYVQRIIAEALPIRASGRERAEWESIVDGVALLATSCSSVEELETRIAEQTQAAKRPHANSVVLSTVHSAKGLEWDTVFLAGLEDGVMLHGNSDDIEEERRVAYVAITRAKRRLALTYAAERFGTKSEPSPFLFEMKRGDIIWTGPCMSNADSRLPLVSSEERAQLATKKSHPKSGPTPRWGSRETASPGATPWTSRDDTRLQAAYASSSSLEEMSLILKRSPDEIVSRLVALKFLPTRNPYGALSAEYLRRSLR